MGGDQRTEFTDDVRMTAQRDVCLYPFFEGTFVQFLQTGDLRLRELVMAEVGQRLTAPQRECIAEIRGRPAGCVRCERATAVAREALETAHVDVLAGGPQEVGARPG